MIKLKTPEEIDKLRRGGKILSSVIDAVEEAMKPGVTTEELTNLTEELIEKAGGKPSFKGYKASWTEMVYPSALCVSINEEVVHGLPVPSRTIKEGDVVGIDCGLEYEGMFTDMARTIIVGDNDNKEVKKLVSITKEALMRGIGQIKPGNHISDLSRAIQEHVEDNGFSVVRQLVGHGVGYSAHEEPQIPNFVDKTIKDIEFKTGMVVAIEPMVNIGDYEVNSEDDGWTITTKDKSISAHFEHTVVVTEDGFEIITK
jgi:methionyl aminopeptidase